ncbi:hypothetical protein QFZ85_001928 [Pseudomonas frederiksbergensis]
MLKIKGLLAYYSACLSYMSEFLPYEMNFICTPSKLPPSGKPTSFS